ncbi:TonB-dependent siderophore receptor [Nostoc sp. FACHB-280]|uniref:TonB-dependent siderophore receptor n=1 Tax=Nostoc sp. FACHB-280 TaxID=2692839 RepID=UPI00168B5C3E|nr:TonB-dependent siderophore receptor [Nostoc sp. FACHB-280]MBD2494897.1 TonB-dependent siderophore receptor [Nostoc sp. FACHB-280]
MKIDQLFRSLLLTSAIVCLIGTAVKAEDVEEDGIVQPLALKGEQLRAKKLTNNIPQLSEIKLPGTNAWMLVQTPTTPTNPEPNSQTQVVPITGVKATPTDKGVEIILETTAGEQLQVVNRSSGNNFIADIPNAQLRLPSGDTYTFRSDKPLTEITEITVTNVDTNTVRVTVVGEKAAPTVELFDDNTGLIFAVASTTTAMQPSTQPAPEQPASETPSETPSAPPDEPIELVVTGEQDTYRVPEASTVTRTDTPLRDIPQSIQIIPQEVLRDQRADTSTALLNAPSVRNSAPSNFDSLRLRVRGFLSQPTLDGIKETNGFGSNVGPDLTGIERIEVLQGPNSVLFGSTSPGGTVNFVTKQPLRDPYYFVEATVGSFDFYRGEVDLSGPLDEDKKALYRLNASYRDQGFFTDRSQTRNLVIAPVLSLALTENTNLAIEATYKYLEQEDYNLGLPALGTIFTNPNGQIPRSRITNEGDLDVTNARIGYRLEHKFNENWSINNTFRYGYLNYDASGVNIGTRLLADNRTLLRTSNDFNDRYRDFRLTTNVIGKFDTGSIKHQLLFGVDLGRLNNTLKFTGRSGASIDIFNPVYGQARGDVTFELDTKTVTDELGIVLQDQVAIADNLKLLVSGRFDVFTQTDQDFLAGTESSQTVSAWSPRVGIVYQPIQPISLYANYSRSFEPAIGRAFDGREFEPTRGTQYEVGVKADLNSRLSTTLAFYDITQSNVLTDDPNNVGFSIQTGEQRSQGLEFSIAGEILPGWNVFASYAYNDARVTADNSIPVGSRVLQTTPHAASLWTTYEIQRGNLQGLGFGLGLFYVGDRAGDNGNTFEVPSYVTTNAAVFYKQDGFRAAINIRNLFDVDYFENSFNRLRVSYGEPFTVQGTISWTF